MKILINTPSGNIGRVVTQLLLAGGHEVTLISRNPDKVQDFLKRGARLVRGSIDDAATLEQAFAGNEAALWLPPLVYDQPQFLDWARGTGRLAAATAARHHLKRVVLISSVGAQHASGTGPIACMPAIEQAFAAAVPELVSLRCGHFMENFLPHLPSMLRDGAIYTPHPTHLPMPLVASRDVAQVTARWLQSTAQLGNVVTGVHGPADLTHHEAAQIIGAGLGREVRHVEIPVAAAEQGMLKAGMPAHVAALLAELYQGVREGVVVRAEARSAETTTTTTLATFTRDVLVPALARATAA
ncbi:MAG TPA: NAD(P)H-binding protein [Polyangiaceae bacterium]|nr:NAD(P)H-binding protein [Polyangiaceae bacterium]